MFLYVSTTCFTNSFTSSLNSSSAIINGYENNTIIPPVDNFLKLTILYNSSVDYILELDDKTNLFIDELPIIKQNMMLEIFESVRKEYHESKIKDDKDFLRGK